MKTPSGLRLGTWLALLVGGAVLPLLVFAAFTLSRLASTHWERQAQAQIETSRALALAVDAEIRAWKAALLALAESNEVAAASWAGLHAEASRVAAAYDGWIILTDPSGQQLFNTLRPYGTPLPTSPDTIRAVFADAQQPTVTDVFFGKTSQRFVVSVAVPVRREGRVAYVLDMGVSPERLSRLLERQGLPPTWVAGINDRQGRVVARSSDAARRVGQPARGWRAEIAGEATSGLFSGALGDGREGLTAFQRLSEVPWFLVLFIPAAELSAAGHMPLWRFLMAGALLAIAAIGGGAYLGRKIARPVNRLAALAPRLVRGDAPLVKPSVLIREVQDLQAVIVEAGEAAQDAYRERERAVVAEARATAVAAAEERLRLALAGADQGLWDWDLRSGELTWDRRCKALFNLPPDAPVSYELHLSALHPDDRDRIQDAGEAALRQHTEFDAEYRVVLPDGGVRWVLSRGRGYYDPGGQPIRMAGTVLDITARKQAEEQLREALAAKDAALADNIALLREVHHRVKNNLQMLCDMLYLQMERVADTDEAGVLQDTYGRIYAIARLHEQLYQSMQGGQVRLCEYLRRLTSGLTHLYGDVSVTITAPEDGIDLDLDRAIHVGLMVNELVTNALKHAYPRGTRGDVTVTVQRVDDAIELCVRDTGLGLPAGLDLSGAKTLGLRIVQILAHRLDAKVTVGNQQGARFTFTFPRHAEPPIEPASVTRA
jgi:PAS domain S-box-containing protein